MIDTNTLVITCSKQMIVDGKNVFNVHVEDYSDLSKYIFADILLPGYEIIDSNLLDDEELEQIVCFCKEHYDALLSMSKEHS